MGIHRHHKIPKHMGGSNDPENIVELTVEDHAIAHFVLWKMHGHWQDEVAWLGLSKRISFDDANREASRLANLGRPKSEEQKRKHSEFMKGNKYGRNNKGKPNHQLGLKRSDETKEMIRQKALVRPRVSCLACKKQDLPLNQWKQWHINRRCS